MSIGDSKQQPGCLDASSQSEDEPDKERTEALTRRLWVERLREQGTPEPAYTDREVLERLRMEFDWGWQHYLRDGTTGTDLHHYCAFLESMVMLRLMEAGLRPGELGYGGVAEWDAQHALPEVDVDARPVILTREQWAELHADPITRTDVAGRVWRNGVQYIMEFN